MNWWPSHSSNRHSFYQPPKISLKSKWISHMFSDLKAVGPHFKGLVFNTIGQWFDVNLGRASWMHWRKSCSHSLENKNLSNFLQIGFSCKLNEVKDTFLKGGSINSHSRIRSSKSLMLEVNLEPPNFYEILLMTLKSPLTHRFEKVKPERSWSSNQKSFLKTIDRRKPKRPFFLWLQLDCNRERS